MSKIFKRPKSYFKMGSAEARLIKAAQAIKTQEQLDGIVATALHQGVSKTHIRGWLEHATPHLPFKPDLPKAIATV